jgi:hypothetical protein
MAATISAGAADHNGLLAAAPPNSIQSISERTTLAVANYRPQRRPFLDSTSLFTLSCIAGKRQPGQTSHSGEFSLTKFRADVVGRWLRFEGRDHPDVGTVARASMRTSCISARYFLRRVGKTGWCATSLLGDDHLADELKNRHACRVRENPGECGPLRPHAGVSVSSNHAQFQVRGAFTVLEPPPAEPEDPQRWLLGDLGSFSANVERLIQPHNPRAHTQTVASLALPQNIAMIMAKQVLNLSN